MKWRGQGWGGGVLIYVCWIAQPRVCISRGVRGEAFAGSEELPGAKQAMHPPQPLDGPHFPKLGTQNCLQIPKLSQLWSGLNGQRVGVGQKNRLT